METDKNGKLICPCGKHYAKPLSLVGAKSRVLLFDGARVYDENEILSAEVVRNKVNPALWGLKNLSKAEWKCTLPNGDEKQIPSGKAAPIFVDTKIEIGENKFNIIEDKE